MSFWGTLTGLDVTESGGPLVLRSTSHRGQIVETILYRVRQVEGIVGAAAWRQIPFAPTPDDLPGCLVADINDEIDNNDLIGYHSHALTVEVTLIVYGTDPTFDARDLAYTIGTAVAGERTLGGLCDYITPIDAPLMAEMAGDNLSAMRIGFSVHYRTPAWTDRYEGR